MHLRGHYYNLYMQQFREELTAQYDPFGTGEHHGTGGTGKVPAQVIAAGD